MFNSPQKNMQSPQRNVLLQKSYSATPQKPNEHLTVAQIAKKFNLVSTFETLEGHETLGDKEMKLLLEYSYILAKD
jgi:hypothetical protein